MWEALFAMIISGFIGGAIVYVGFLGYGFYKEFRDIYRQYKKDLANLTVDINTDEE